MRGALTHVSLEQEEEILIDHEKYTHAPGLKICWVKN